MSNEDIQRYGILMSYMQYENTMYWQRGSFFLVAETALLGFALTNLPALAPSTPWERILIPILIGITGLVLAQMWHNVLRAGERWIYRWHSLLEQLEPKAFGELKIFRGLAEEARADTKKPRVRKQAYNVVALFYLLWSISIIYCIYASVLKVLSL